MTKQGHNLPDCDGTYYANDSHIKERGECAINEEMMAKFNVPKCNPAKRTNIKKKITMAGTINVWIVVVSEVNNY